MEQAIDGFPGAGGDAGAVLFLEPAPKVGGFLTAHIGILRPNPADHGCLLGHI